MISVKDNKTALHNLGVTFEAIQQLDILIKDYSHDLPGPAYVTFNHVASGNIEAQIDRKIILVALSEQRHKLIDYLASLGIEWDL